jgi:hypothetical protein
LEEDGEGREEEMDVGKVRSWWWWRLMTVVALARDGLKMG